MFYSILFPTREQYEVPRNNSEPDYFKDLNLDLIFSPIFVEERAFGLKVRSRFNLESFFYTPLQDTDAIVYRQDVMRELEKDEFRSLITDFIHIIYDIESDVAIFHDSITSEHKWRDNYLTRGKFLDCTQRYCQAISSLSRSLSEMKLNSAGFCSFAEYLKDYLASDETILMQNHAKRLRDEFSKVEYCMLIKYGTIRVRQFQGEADIVKEILDTFSKFRQDESEELKYRSKFSEESQDDRMEATLLNMIAGFYKKIFSELNDFCSIYYNFVDEAILRFSYEVQFYLSWLDLIAPLRERGLKFCYPKICNSGEQHLYCFDGFDLALAFRKHLDEDGIVTNDFELRPSERIIVVTGANQSGKTTFARSFGQVHHLASLGLCVPGRNASLFLFDSILTHFELEEDLSTLVGKLQDDLIRLRTLFLKATGRSLIIINEIFSSTTLSDALSLGKRMMNALIALGVPCMVVTFLDELATHGPETVSMMSVVGEDPGRRLYKIERKPPDGLAYAIHLAEKHCVTYEQLTGRLSK